MGLRGWQAICAECEWQMHSVHREHAMTATRTHEQTTGHKRVTVLRVGSREPAAQTIAPDVVTVDTLRRILEAFNSHDLDAIMAFFADDCVLEMPRGPHPWGQRFLGKAPVREGLASRFAGIPDVRYGEDRHWVSGTLGVSEWTLTGTARDGSRVEVRGCDHFEFRDGKIVKKDSYWKIVEPR